MGEHFDREQEAGSAIALQEAVFSAPNTLRADTFGVLEWALRRHRQVHGDRPLLLAFKAVGEELVTWYACARTEPMKRALAQELGAFLGASYVQMAAPDRTPDAADAHMLLQIGRAGWQALRFTASSSQ